MASKRIAARTMLNTLIAALFVRMLLSFAFDDFGLVGVDRYARLGVDFNSNAIAGGAFFLLVALTLRRRQFRKYWVDTVLVCCAALMLVVTASVKFFLAAALFFICVFFYDISKKAKPGRIKKSIVLAWGLVILAVSVLPQTSLVARALDKYERSVEAESSTQLFDNRAAQYILGWQEFVDNPINGIGLRNFLKQSGNTAPLHSEYLVQLVENGLIGMLLFILFWYSLIRRLVRTLSFHCQKESGLIHCFSIAVLLYLYLGIWSYNIPLNWIPIGMALRHIWDVKRAASAFDVSDFQGMHSRALL